MFSQAYIYLTRALKQSFRQAPNFYTIRDLLKAANSEVLKDPKQPERLKQLASAKIQNAISYTYSRTKPAPPFTPMNFQTMVSTPISPYQNRSRGPFGYVVGPIVPGRPDLVPTQWTNQGQEAEVLSLMIREAMNTVRQGL